MAISDEQLDKKSDKRIKDHARKQLPESINTKNGTADWENADGALIHSLVCAISREGGAVRFGYTRDGGAYSIGLYLGDNSKTLYCNEADGINDTLREVVEYFTK